MSAAVASAPSAARTGDGEQLPQDSSLPLSRLSALYARNAALSSWMFSAEGQEEGQPPLSSAALEGTEDRSNGSDRSAAADGGSSCPFPPTDRFRSPLFVLRRSVRLRVLHCIRRAYVDAGVAAPAVSSAPPLPPSRRPPPSSSPLMSPSSSLSTSVFLDEAAESSVTSLVLTTVQALQSSPQPASSPSHPHPPSDPSTALALRPPASTSAVPPSSSSSASSAAVVPFDLSSRSRALALSYSTQSAVPTWHAPWRLLRVMAGHAGWVRGVAVDPSNDFFVSASNDRTLKAWDLATGELRLTLTGHVSAVRAVALSSRHPYLFSASEDKTVKQWDLEQNCVIRNYHGHLSAVYCLALHPALDLLVSGGRDSACRLWDMRSKAEVAVLAGHTNTVASLLSQSVHPQVISGSHDATVRLWDIRKASTAVILTHHKKSVRALAQHPTEFTFASAGADALKVWKCPEGALLRNLASHDGIVNSLAVNRDDVLVSGGDDGSLCFHDWRSGYRFDRQVTIAQSGSLDSERGIFQAQFDVTGSRLLTAEADKTVKYWAEVEDATPSTHPINWKPVKRKRY